MVVGMIEANIETTWRSTILPLDTSDQQSYPSSTMTTTKLNDTHPLHDPKDPIGTRITKEVDASRRRVANAMGAFAALTDHERRALIAELLWEEEKRDLHDHRYVNGERVTPGGTPDPLPIKPGLVRTREAAKTPKPRRPYTPPTLKPVNVSEVIRRTFRASAPDWTTVAEIAQVADGVDPSLVRQVLGNEVKAKRASRKKIKRGGVQVLVFKSVVK